MATEIQCIDALRAADNAALDQGAQYVIPSRLRRALLLCQRYLAERHGEAPPLHPQERLSLRVAEPYKRLAIYTEQLAMRIKRFQFMSEALQELVARQDGAIRDDLAAMRLELERLASSAEVKPFQS
jgi:hypothetical protein